MTKLNKIIHPDLLHDNIAKSLLCFALPVLVSYIFQQLYNAVDTIIVGHYLNENSLAAMGACSSIYDLIIGFGTGFGSGMGLVAARAFGAANEERLKKSVAASIVITIAVTLILIALSLLCVKPLLILLKTPSEILEESLSYIIVICIWCGVMFAYNLASGMLRAIGNSFMPLVFLIISAILNIFLDILFITKFNLGIKGAAIATVISQLISALLCLIYIFIKAKILIPSFKKRHFKFEKNIYKELLGQGLSMAFMSSLVSSGTVILQSAINSFGTIIMAGHVSARKIFSITNIPIITLGISSATFVSQNYGAGYIDRIKKGVKLGCTITTVWAILLVIVMPFVVRPLLSFISGSQNAELLDYGQKYLLFAFPFYIVLGVLIVLRNSLQGLGAKILPLGSSLIELLGKIIFTALIIPHLGIWGVILCEPLIWCVMTLHLIYAFVKRMKKLTVKTE
jgi:putative MATE family efflux protein